MESIDSSNNSAIEKKIARNKKYYFKSEKSQFINLDDATITELINLYSTSIHTVKEITKKYDGLNVSSFYKDLPYELTDRTCEMCNEPLYQKVSQRSLRFMENWLCLACGHDNSSNCSCSPCKTKQEEVLKNQRKEFYEKWNNYYDKNFATPHLISDLNLTDLIYLELIFIFTKSIDDNTIDSNMFQLNRLNFDYETKTILEREGTSKIKEFLNRKILIPKREFTPIIHSYEIMTSNYDLFYYNQLVLNLINPDTNSLFTLEEYKSYFNEKIFTEKELKFLKREIYDYLIKEYTFSLSNKSLRSKISEITIDSILDELAENFSISKAMNMIYYAISSTIYNMNKYKYSDENKMNSHFRNRVIESIEKNKHDQSLLKDFDLPYTIKLRLIDHYVLDNILKNKGHYLFDKLG